MCVPYVKAIFHCMLFLRKRQVVIREIRFVSNAFLSSEFKLKNISPLKKIFTGKMFAVVFICGNFFMWMAGKIAIKSKKSGRANCLATYTVAYYKDPILTSARKHV